MESNLLVLIADKEYTFQESAQILAQAISSIVDKNDEASFSIGDILCMLRSVNERVPGEFEIIHTRSHYYKIIYKSEEEVIERFKEKWQGFIG